MKTFVTAPVVVAIVLVVAGPFGVHAQGNDPASVPATPDKPTGKAIWAGIVDMEWNEVAGADSYELQYFNFSDWIDIPGHGISVGYYGAGAVVKGLAHSWSNTFRVRAVNTHGASGWSMYGYTPQTDGPRAWVGVPEPVNVPATGSVVLSSSVEAPESLTVDISGLADENGLDRVKIFYRWSKVEGTTDVEIEGAEGLSYTVPDGEERDSIRFRVSFTDRHGFAETLDSGPPVYRNEAPTGLPAIAGKLEVGNTLTADTSGIADKNGLEDVEFSYQWIVDDVDVEGATGDSYVMRNVHVPHPFKVRVSFIDNHGHHESLTSEARMYELPTPTDIAVTSVPIVVESTTDDYFVLYAVQELDDVDVELPVLVKLGEEGSTTLSENIRDLPADSYRVEKYLVSDPGDADGDCIDDITEMQNYGDMGPVNRAQIFSDLLGAATIPDHETFEALSYKGQHILYLQHLAYHEFVNFYIIGINTDQPAVYFINTETTRSFMNARRLLGIDRFRESPHDVRGSIVYHPNLQARGGSMGAYSFDFLFNVEYDFELVSRAYTALAASMGMLDDNLMYHPLDNAWDADFKQTRANLMRFDEERELYDASRIQLLLRADFPSAVTSGSSNTETGLPTISGISQVGMTLTADTSGITDEDGLENASYSYQWLADDAQISDATGSSYTPTTSEQGKAIKVKVSFTDDDDNAETRTSSATDEVAPKPLVGFTLVDATYQSDEMALADDSTVILVDPANGSYGIRVELADGARVESIRPELSGPKSYSQIENVAPFSLYGDTCTYLNGEGLPPGSYTLSATAYSKDNTHGEELQTLEISFTVSKANTPAAGAPVITGTAQVGQTLTADTSGITDDDGLDNVSYSYQWVSNDGTSDVDIAGATGSTYTLKEADGDKAIKVRVNFTDDAGNEESLTSLAASDLSTNSLTSSRGAVRDNSPATGQPSINGTAQVDQALTADATGIIDADGLTNAVFAYQWLAGGSEISGATGSTFTLTTDQQGQTITVRVTFTDDVGNEESLTSEATAAVTARANSAATGQPSITGTAQVGQVLTADASGISDADGLTNAVFAYQWLAGGSEISGATGSTFTLTTDQQGQTITVRVTFTDDAGNAESLTSEATAAVFARANSAATGQPLVTGTPLSGETLEVDTSEIEDANGLTTPNFSYQWIVVRYQTDNDISGATGSSYVLASQHVGKPVKVRVSFTDDDGHTESLTSPALNPAQPTGLEATVSEQSIALSWTAPAVFDYLFDYRIERETPELDDADVVAVDTGSSATSYTDTDVQPGVLYRYRVRAANYWNQLSPASVTVDIRAPQGDLTEPADNSPATGRPTITGTAQVGQLLAAGTTGITDADGLSDAVYAYQWLAGGSEISGETSSTFTLVAAQQGQTITVRVTFTDDAGNAESLTSAATAAVASAGSPTSPPSKPTDLTGSVNSDGHITLSWTAPDDASVTGYQILRRRPRLGENRLLVYVENTGSAATTYTDTSAPAGTLYVYRVKAINAAGVGPRSNYVNVDLQ